MLLLGNGQGRPSFGCKQTLATSAMTAAISRTHHDRDGRNITREQIWSWPRAANQFPKWVQQALAIRLRRNLACRSSNPRPGLVPLTFSDDDSNPWRVAAPARVSANDASFDEAMLVHPSRPVRPCNPASLVILARGRDDHRQPDPQRDLFPNSASSAPNRRTQST